MKTLGLSKSAHTPVEASRTTSGKFVVCNVVELQIADIAPKASDHDH
jgi:hypothetical protein